MVKAGFFMDGHMACLAKILCVWPVENLVLKPIPHLIWLHSVHLGSGTQQHGLPHGVGSGSQSVVSVSSLVSSVMVLLTLLPTMPAETIPLTLSRVENPFFVYNSSIGRMDCMSLFTLVTEGLLS